MTKVLVTGGTGFIGSHITRFLVKSGHSVRVLDDNTRGKNSRIDDVISEIELIEGDVSNFSLTESACKNIDTVIHLAFINGTSNFYNHPDKVLDVAIKGILSIASAISKWDIKDLILASSSEVYQFPDIFPTPENIQMVVPDLANPRYSYGLGKIIQEYYSYHAIRELNNLTIFRPHNIYGPNMGKLHVIPELILKIKKQIKKNSINLKIQGSGKETRAFCYIDDAINAINLIIKKGKDGEIYNIGNDKEISINNLVNMISKILKKKIYIKKGVLRKGSTKRRCPNIKKIKKIGFLPKVQINEGIIKTLNYYL